MFLDWLALPPGLEWFDVGCGTGALAEAIVCRCAPRRVVGVDPSGGFVATAASRVRDHRVAFEVGDARELPASDASCDVAVAGLVVNFVPGRAKALREMRRIVRPGGRVAFYVLDYPGGGVAFMRAFWNVAIELDPAAADLAEGKRFPFCTPGGLRHLCGEAGLDEPEVIALEAESVFPDFDDYWRPFTLGAGPAPGHRASLASDAQSRLREALRASLPVAADGSITLPLRAWGVKTTSI